MLTTTTVRSTVLVMLGSVACFAQLTDFERDFALSHLYASEKMFLVSVEGLSPAQLNFRAAPNRWSIAECAEHIALAEDWVLDYVRSGQDDLRHHVAQHPAGYTLDGYQWILLLSAHTQRHVAQIEEVKADPSFPKN
jgi:hypothetical protein